MRQSKYTREILADAVASSVSIAGVLRHIGLTMAGGSHAHISRRIKFYGLDTSHFTGQAQAPPGHDRVRHHLPMRSLRL